jgi:hypothetical protein
MPERTLISTKQRRGYLSAPKKCVRILLPEHTPYPCDRHSHLTRPLDDAVVCLRSHASRSRRKHEVLRNDAAGRATGARHILVNNEGLVSFSRTVTVSPVVISTATITTTVKVYRFIEQITSQH